MALVLKPNPKKSGRGQYWLCEAGGNLGTGAERKRLRQHYGDDRKLLLLHRSQFKDQIKRNDPAIIIALRIHAGVTGAGSGQHQIEAVRDSLATITDVEAFAAAAGYDSFEELLRDV
jgi:hypothetical protein